MNSAATGRGSLVALLICLPLAMAAGAGPSLVVNLPEGLEARSAVADAPALKLQTSGQIAARTITFANLLPDTPYDLTVTLADGRKLCGVDLGWYSAEPPKADAGELTEDDRQQITALVRDVRQFYDKSEILHLSADHDRAVTLVQQLRTTAFHSGKGDEVIWRMEVWYFRNRAGGWERISQTNKVLRRERFATRKEFGDTVSAIQWMPQLGGIRIARDQARMEIAVPAPTTRPATQAAR